MSVPWVGAVTLVNVTDERGEEPVRVTALGPVVETTSELASAKPGTCTAAVMAFSIEAMVLTSLALRPRNSASNYSLKSMLSG